MSNTEIVMYADPYEHSACKTDATLSADSVEADKTQGIICITDGVG